MQIPLLSGLASGYAFVPPSAGSVLVANALGVNLGTMIMVDSYSIDLYAGFRYYLGRIYRK